MQQEQPIPADETQRPEWITPVVTSFDAGAAKAGDTVTGEGGTFLS